MKVLRTPEERFAGLPDFGYKPRYADAGGLRLAYVEAFREHTMYRDMRQCQVISR